MKASDYIAEFIYQKGITTVFGYQGGMITHLVDSIDKHPHVAFIQTYHEQSAAIAAEGYARSGHKVGVAISTSGPGATNMITGIADAFFDSIPVIYITGQVNSYEYKYDKPIRQLGFQETDVVSMVKPVTKYAKMIDKATDLCYELEKAYHIATTGRRGPVLLDITMDVQRTDIDMKQVKHFVPLESPIQNVSVEQLKEITEMFKESKRPMMLIGGGVFAASCVSELRELINKLKIPVIYSLMGKGACPDDDPLTVGLVGSYGNRCANMAVANCDLLLVLGSRLDTRQTGAKYDGFMKHGKIIHVDIDAAELSNHRLNNRFCVESDVKDFIKVLSNINIQLGEIDPWIAYIGSLKSKYNQQQEVERFIENKAPYKLIETINKYSKSTDLFCSDIGQNQMWVAQALQLFADQRYYTSGGLAPMGYSVPVAVGASFDNKERNVWALCGDGGFHISTQSLMLISQYNLPVKVIVINNESLGMITQFQELYFNNNLAGTAASGGYLVPKIEKIAEAYNLQYFQLTELDLTNNELIVKITSTQNCIVEFLTRGLTKIAPKLEFDKSIENPSPHLDDKELKANMLV